MDLEEKFLAVGEACVVIGRLTPGFEGQTFLSSEFPREGTVICYVHSILLQVCKYYWLA